MTMVISRGSTAALSVEWREYPGGPMAVMDDVTITIAPLAGGAAVVGPTQTGVLEPATGINAYHWAVSLAATPGDYLISWSGTDADLETVTATEIVTVLAITTANIGGPYATRADLKVRMGIPDSNTARDDELDQRLLSASSDINNWCNRQFGRSETATLREFKIGASGVDTDDFWTSTDLAITPYLGTTAGTAWDVSTLVLEPLNGIVNQVPGWPYRRISMSGFGAHPLWMASNWSGYTVRIAAKWGWEAIPEPVVTSCLMLAVADDKAKDAPFGVAGFGDYAVRIRANPMVEQKLKPYVVDGGLLVAS